MFTDKIEWIIKNQPYFLLADFGEVSNSTAKQWKTGEKDWRKSKFESIEALYKNYINSECDSLKKFIEDDLAEKELGHEEIDSFNGEDILDGKVISRKHNRLEVVISLNEVDNLSVADVFMVDFAGEEIYIYYLNT